MALQKYSGFPKKKVVGMAGILDSSRFIYFLSQETKIPVQKINSFVLLTNNYHMPRAMLEFKSIFNDISITPYAFVDENKKWWKTKINYISEYFKYKLTYLRIHLLQF